MGKTAGLRVDVIAVAAAPAADRRQYQALHFRDCISTPEAVSSEVDNICHADTTSAKADTTSVDADSTCDNSFLILAAYRRPQRKRDA
jgi:hypothetical protein